MTKYGIVSDLHLEFYSNHTFNMMLDKINNCGADVILLAGDIHSGMTGYDIFLSEIEKPYHHVFGNHDFYQNRLLTNDFFDKDGVVGACLWTNFGNDDLTRMMAQKHINDFRLIKSAIVDGAKMTPEEMSFMYDGQKQRIFASDSEIVLTHFPPSLQTIAPKFNGDPLNRYFVNDLDSEITYSNKKLWISGHTHAIWDFYVGNCRLVSNPLGYPREIYEIPDYYEVKVVEV